MTRAFKCKECGNIVDFDSYPPGLREIYLTLEHAKLCEVCGRDLKIVKEEPMATKLMKDEECSHDSLPRTKKPTEEEIKQAIIDSEILRQDYYELWGLLVNSNVYLPNVTEPTSATFRFWGGLLSEIDNQNTDYMSYYCSSDINGKSARQKQIRKTLEGIGWWIIKYKDGIG